MKLNEPRQNEIDKWPKGDILRQERRNRMIELRIEGRTFQEIAYRFNCTHQRVQQIIKNPPIVKTPQIQSSEGIITKTPEKSPFCRVQGCKDKCKGFSLMCAWHKVHGETSTRGGIILQGKDYVDYLKESTYKESYKKFCISNYLTQKKSLIINDEIDSN